MAKAQPTADDKINLAIKKARAGNAKSLARLIAEASPGDLAYALVTIFDFEGSRGEIEDVLGVVASIQAERERVRAEKNAAQRAARARYKAIVTSEYLGGVHVGC
jgi:hypothetical protein